MALGWREQYIRYKEFYLNVQALYKQRADLRAFLEIILSITTVIVFLIFALKPTALTIISLYNGIQEKRATKSALDQKLNDLDTANTLLTQNQALLPDIESTVSNAARPDTITQQIQALAAKNSVTILGVSIGQITLVGTGSSAKTSTELKPLPGSAKGMDLSVSVKGDYANLISFLKDFENLRLVSKIDTMGISSTVTDKGTTIVSVISGRVPYLSI